MLAEDKHLLVRNRDYIVVLTQELSKNAMYQQGPCQFQDGVLCTLKCLLETYPATEFDYDLGVGFIGYLNHLLTCSSYMTDITVHSLLLTVSSRLLAACGRDA